ncbi:oligosaccharide flippase family protein [Microbacterium sp. Kw_RZR3]|uniref:lipopolysaccharide biosynthesis protein n=1 Tax=Microbacterium sp. Kw_RZR3 TaxID=3032903 RepID=UPI0023DA785D|nr:oligosaccharide flippase family protein [Microbacterium sp. Kw_RZR3]MDF2045937.1 oligosaccharide flippase family protein [Microbacterium sp. Kw_RZR3]
MTLNDDGSSPTRKTRSLGTQAVALAAGTALAQVIVAVLYIVTAREAGPEGYGQLVAAIALGGSALGFFDFGTSAFWIRERASGRMDLETFSARVTRKLVIAVAFFTLAMIFALIWLPQLVPSCAIFLAGTFTQTTMVPLRAARRGEVVAALSIVERAAAVPIFTIALAVHANPLQSLWVALVVGTLTAGVAACLFSRSVGRANFRWRPGSNPWRGAKFYGLSALATSAQQLDLPVLTAVAGPVASGIYGGVNRWTQPMGVLASAFSSASAPFIAHARDWKATQRLVTRAAWLLVLAVCVCAGLAFAAPILVSTLLGTEFAGSAHILQLLAVGTIPAIINQPLAAALQARRYDHLVASVYLASVVIQLGLVFSLGGTLGALGAAIAFCVLQVLMLLSLITCVTVAVRRDGHREKDLGNRNA